jgi:DNA-binding LytR/AlgR family response regulator
VTLQTGLPAAFPHSLTAIVTGSPTDATRYASRAETPAKVELMSALNLQYGTGESMLLRALVAEQGELARIQLRSILLGYPDVRVVGDAADGPAAFEKIKRLEPDLVFLDLEMPGVDAFDAVSGFNGHTALVLTSTFHQHAIRAFDSNALDFLLKPYNADRVDKTISRARTAFVYSRERSDLRLSHSGENNCLGIRPLSRLAVHKGKRVLLLSLKDIAYFKVENRLVFSFTEDRQYLVNRTVTELERLLGADGFFRVNRGTIINLEYLLEIIPWFSGTFRLKLTTGVEFPLSRDRVATLKALVGLPNRWTGK